MYDCTIHQAIASSAHAILTRLHTGKYTLPSDGAELVLQVPDVEKPYEVEYYLVNHDAKRLYWLDGAGTNALSWEMQGSLSDMHIGTFIIPPTLPQPISIYRAQEI